MKLVRYADRPELRQLRERFWSNFPEFMNHNEPGTRYWGRLYEEFGPFQLCLLDGDEPVAEGHSIPIAWNGTLEDLPSGWDEAFTRGAERSGVATVLCALVISVLPERRGQGLSRRMIDAFKEAARADGLRALIAPVRPTWKERYPLIPIERYMTWRREDGAPFDPWLRIHERAGGEILAPAPESMTIEAPVSDWEQWTGMRLPEDGTYVIPGALAPLEVRNGRARHVEPNVWMRHEL